MINDKEIKMNFNKAHKELLNGERIRRKEWEPLMHMFINEKKDNIITYRGEHTAFYANSSFLLSDGWILEGSEKELSFLEALDLLKMKAKLTHKSWRPHEFIFVDGDKFALCKAVEYPFMPSYKDFCSSDWEILK